MRNLLKCLIFPLAALWMAACSPVGTRTNERMVGAYSPYSRITKAESALFKETLAAHPELKLKPAKVSRQVVAGTNYRFQCTDAAKKKVEVVIHEPLPGNGRARILSIDGKAVK